MGGESHVTMNGLEAVLTEVRGGGLPLAFSRRTQARERHAAASVSTPYGPVVQTVTLPVRGGDVTLPVQAPLPMLYEAAKRKPFADLLTKALARAPGTAARPWSLILYSDEVTPGNALKPDNKRKIQSVYWSFKELGSAALCHTDLWFTVAAVRSTLVQELEGGMSHLFKVLLPLFFGHCGHDLATAGVCLQLPGRHQMLHARFACMVSDESAIKQVLLAKGASGMKPCVCCKNVVSRTSGLAAYDATGYIVPVTSVEEHRWDPQTDASVFAILRRLDNARQHLRPIEFAELEKSLGFSWCPHTVVGTPALQRPISTLMWDWMHVYLVNGIFNHEWGRLAQLLRPGVTWQSLHEYLRRWTWPRATTGAGPRYTMTCYEFRHTMTYNDMR